MPQKGSSTCFFFNYRRFRKDHQSKEECASRNLSQSYLKKKFHINILNSTQKTIYKEKETTEIKIQIYFSGASLVYVRGNLMDMDGEGAVYLAAYVQQSFLVMMIVSHRFIISIRQKTSTALPL